MARAKKVEPVIEEIDDSELEELLEEDDDAEELVEELPEDKPAKKPKGDGPVERDTYTAKQIATRIGVDPKVLRKFFRSAASTIEPCGQGGRYEFDAADLPKIKEEFEKYNSTKTPRGRKAEGSKTTKTRGRSAPASAAVIEEDDELLDLDELEEPEEDELLELDEEDDEPEFIEEEDDEELDEDDDLEEADD